MESMVYQTMLFGTSTQKRSLVMHDEERKRRKANHDDVVIYMSQTALPLLLDTCLLACFSSLVEHLHLAERSLSKCWRFLTRRVRLIHAWRYGVVRSYGKSRNGMSWMLCILPTTRYMSASHRTTVSVRSGTHDRQIRSGRPRRRMRRSNRFKLPYLLRRPAHPTTSSFLAPLNHYLVLPPAPAPDAMSSSHSSVRANLLDFHLYHPRQLCVHFPSPNSLRHSATSRIDIGKFVYFLKQLLNTLHTLLRAEVAAESHPS